MCFVETPDTLTTIDLVGSEGLEGLKFDNIEPREVVPSSPFHFPLYELLHQGSPAEQTHLTCILC